MRAHGYHENAKIVKKHLSNIDLTHDILCSSLFLLWLSKNALNIFTKNGWGVFNQMLNESCNLHRRHEKRIEAETLNKQEAQEMNVHYLLMDDNYIFRQLKHQSHYWGPMKNTFNSIYYSNLHRNNFDVLMCLELLRTVLKKNLGDVSQQHKCQILD